MNSKMRWKRWFCLLVFFIVCLAVAGVVLEAVEAPKEKLRLQQLEKLRNEIYEDLIGRRENGTNDEDIQERENAWRRIAEELNLAHLIRNNNLPENRWTLYNSFFVAFTAASTIGYGHLAPASMEGRLFCIVFALLAIPINGILYAKLGDYFGSKIMPEKQIQKMRPRRWFALLTKGTWYFFLGSAIFLAIPAGIFTYAENWAYSDSFYFAFITLTTIGFGDLVAGQSNYGVWTWPYRFFINIWIVFGLGYLAMIISEITKGIRSRLSRKLQKRAIRIKRFVQNRTKLGNFKRIKLVYKTDQDVVQRTRSQSNINEEIDKDASSGIKNLKNLSNSDTALVNIDFDATFAPPQESKEHRQDEKTLEVPVELLERLVDELCENLSSDCSESEETSHSDLEDADDSKRTSALKRFRKSIRGYFRDDVSSDLKENSYQNNNSQGDSAIAQSHWLNEISQHSYHCSTRNRRATVQEMTDQEVNQRKFNRSLSESGVTVSHEKDTCGHFEERSNFSQIEIPTPAQSFDQANGSRNTLLNPVTEITDSANEEESPSTKENQNFLTPDL